MVKPTNTFKRQRELEKARRDRFHARHPGYHNAMYIKHRAKRKRYLRTAVAKAKRAAWRDANRKRINEQLRQQRCAWPFWKRRYKKSLEKANRNAAVVIDRAALASYYERIFTQDAATCDYCRGVFAIREIVVDHKQPYALGGCHVVTNLAVSCYTCNRLKNKIPYDKWISRAH